MAAGNKLAGILVCLLAGSPGLVPAATAQKIGTDLAGLNLCLYGDCEARGTYAADPFGWANPGTMPVLMFAYVKHGLLLSPAYFHLKTGSVGSDISSGSVTYAADPWLVQFNVIYAEAHGPVRSLPGVDISSRTRMARLAAAADLGHTDWKLTGVSVGLLVGVPVLESDLRLVTGGLTLVDSREDHEIELTPGTHWRGGERDWFSVGAVLNAVRNHVSTTTTDPFTLLSSTQHGTTNAWFPRAGVSLLPFVPLGLADTSTPIGEFLGELRLAADLEHQNIAVPTEGVRAQEIVHFGMDARVLPDAWNPVSDYLRVYVIGGADTDGGWGIGPGLYGNGILGFLSCNPAYSSRPIAKSLGDRVINWSATCAAVVPL